LEQQARFADADSFHPAHEVHDAATHVTFAEADPTVPREVDPERGGVLAAMQRTRPAQGVAAATQLFQQSITHEHLLDRYALFQSVKADEFCIHDFGSLFQK